MDIQVYRYIQIWKKKTTGDFLGVEILTLEFSKSYEILEVDLIDISRKWASLGNPQQKSP